ncbi:helix-turn-helix transcriptional regulator [Streptomyces sp. NP-1717]|nr:helix-turn-helix transcriptional regulator [Streptomyces sp. NP-1717]
MPDIMERTLSRRLRELEQCGIVARTAASSAPPGAEYALTSEGGAPRHRHWRRRGRGTGSGPRRAGARSGRRGHQGRRSRAPGDKQYRRRRTGR